MHYVMFLCYAGSIHEIFGMFTTHDAYFVIGCFTDRFDCTDCTGCIQPSVTFIGVQRGSSIKTSSEKYNVFRMCVES